MRTTTPWSRCRRDVWVVALGFGATTFCCGLRPAAGQCSMERGEAQVIGFGTAPRVAVDPSIQAPVVVWEHPAEGIVYRRFLGPDWGVQVKVDTDGVLMTQGQDGLLVQGVDLVLDDYGRPRVALVAPGGLYHTRFTSGWSARRSH